MTDIDRVAAVTVKTGGVVRISLVEDDRCSGDRNCRMCRRRPIGSWRRVKPRRSPIIMVRSCHYTSRSSRLSSASPMMPALRILSSWALTSPFRARMQGNAITGILPEIQDAMRQTALGLRWRTSLPRPGSINCARRCWRRQTGFSLQRLGAEEVKRLSGVAAEWPRWSRTSISQL